MSRRPGCWSKQGGRCLALWPLATLGLLAILLAEPAARAASPLMAQRVQLPEFSTGYQPPATTTPQPPSPFWDYLDLGVLAAALGLATYLALVRRSRTGLVALAIMCLAWLGFRREGCICPIGAIQNVAEAAANPAYAVPLSVVVIFVLPILVALFFGRTFCGAVCPLGAVQELAAVRPVRIPPWLDHSLGLLPYVYLGAAVVFAATGTRYGRATYVICQYDPLVGLFRLSASANMLVLGLCVLVVGLFVGRPYCRYLCPYGAILGLCSKLSKWHVRIPPDECINCRLCEQACPYGAILQPTAQQMPEDRLRGRLRLALVLVLLPVWIGVGAAAGYRLGVPLSRVHFQAALAELVRRGDPGQRQGDIDRIEAFQNTRRQPEQLYADALALHAQYAHAGLWLGAWVGLVIGMKLLSLSIRRRRQHYQPDKAKCVACGRCFWYCPEEQARLGLIETIPAGVQGIPAASQEGPSNG
ncbi:MAG: 4Fe-4S binding protein [Thermoguttaceae bacterium]